MRLLAALLVLCASPAVAETVQFQSPSGNIHCMMSDEPWMDGARCDILSVSTLSYASRPSWCDLDWGQAFYVPNFGGAEPSCAGDTVAGNGFVLQYGQSYTVGNVTCFSDESGMLCRNGSGDGFALRRAAQQVF